jgi:hypothetical protein
MRQQQMVALQAVQQQQQFQAALAARQQQLQAAMMARTLFGQQPTLIGADMQQLMSSAMAQQQALAMHQAQQQAAAGLYQSMSNMYGELCLRAVSKVILFQPLRHHLHRRHCTCFHKPLSIRKCINNIKCRRLVMLQ